MQSTILGPSRVQTLQTLERTVVGPYMHEDVDEAWESLRLKMHWTDLHCLFTNYRSGLSLDTLTAMLQLPGMAVQLNAKDTWGHPPLHYAIQAYPEYVESLLRAGANPWLVKQPLTDAAFVGSHTAINALIRAGVNPNQRNREGRRVALHFAASHFLEHISGSHYRRTAAELVRHAGHALEWDALDKRDWTPLDMAEEHAQKYPDDEDGQAILELYRTRRLPRHAQYISPPSIIEIDGDEDTSHPMSLVAAGLRGDLDAIGELIRLGAMVNERDDGGYTLLHLVGMGKVQNGYKVALEVVRHGGYGVDWDAGTPEGETALELTQQRLAREDINEDEWEEAERVVHLLTDRELPRGEYYIFPCMDPIYCWRCSSLECVCAGVHIPGAFIP